MKRRNFLNCTVSGSLAALVGSPALGTGPGPEPPESKSAAFLPYMELEEATITDLQAGMQAGRYTARSIAEMYLARIDAVDKTGPTLNAVIEINRNAVATADLLDKERRTTGPRGPLHGIPLLIKDNIDTGDEMQTTAGSLALVGSPPAQDAFLVARLREAGAVILGKANLSEWANFRSGRSSSGWSGRGGQTRNPYALDRNPCGSSSGSAVAVAANLCAVSVGTETDGSIMCPSSVNGLIGIKPTLGLVSRSGIIPIAHSQDTAGPMARTVTDAVILLGAMTGLDPLDIATRERRAAALADYTPFLDPGGLRGARIGVARNYFGFHEKVDALMTEAIEAMKGEGAVIVDPAEVPNKGETDAPEFEVLLYEFKSDLGAYLARRGGPVRSLADIIAFNEQNREVEMPYFGQEILLQAEEKGPLSSPEYLEALRTGRRLAREEGIDAVLRKHRLDALVAPTQGPAGVTDLVNGDHLLGGSAGPAAVAGYPNVTVPAGYVHGLPVGISFFGGAFSEATLIRIAYAFEQATKVRKPALFLATANLG